ncbi:cupin domain-containing protein [Deinococcus cellulosilyticus]|uniref:Cupin n=1 Tax=Deinococcus cellulosilyticus (strain DSM 18568 / NBRC 106333 / KACC 11606 / 5516J-15) TaxID=1223518 RepID=A0A511N7D7_DEIC1|nr:cupin domain-containing protein [Deinococcus cellulosilyticus]GEM48763.1 cupin [Deinococcus cellulosilyticus NBRC 106333 = KACC 11606]
MKVSTFNTEHYLWGNSCDGWKLLTQPGLSVIQEKMPAGTSEVAHYHEKAEQFFFVLSGKLTLRFPDGDVELSIHEGMHVAAQRPHIAMNLSSLDVHFLVISSPSTVGDRVVTADMG